MPRQRRAAAPIALPPLATTPLDAGALPNTTLVRLAAASPPRQLLTALYGDDARVALDALAATDTVLRRELGGVHLVQPADWVRGAGAGWILAPFVRAPGPDTASRFTDGSYGVWYGAESLATAQAEVGHHLGAYLARTGAVPDTLPRTVLHATPDPMRPLIDLRPPAPVPAGVLSAASYTVSQPFGAACRTAEHWGIVWPSVRRASGTCVAVFRPPLLRGCRVAGRCHAHWDGSVLTWGS